MRQPQSLRTPLLAIVPLSIAFAGVVSILGATALLRATPSLSSLALIAAAAVTLGLVSSIPVHATRTRRAPLHTLFMIYGPVAITAAVAALLSRPIEGFLLCLLVFLVGCAMSLVLGAPEPAPLLCERCGHDVSETEGPLCPTCGAELPRDQLSRTLRLPSPPDGA